MEKRVASAGAEEASRIRSEVYNAEAALQRKTEEVRGNKGRLLRGSRF